MRKTVLPIAVLASAALVLTGCSGDDSSSESEDTTSSEATTEESEGDSDASSDAGLVVWVDETRMSAVQTAADAFEADTGTAVELVLKNFEDIKADFTAQVPTGEGPDITVGAHDWLGELTSNAVIAPIELGDSAGDFEESAINAFTYNGQVYGLPYAIENVALIRNAGLVPDAPATWDEMIAAGEAAGTTYPFVIQMNGEAGDPFTFYPLQTSFGSTVFVEENGEFTSELNLATGGDEYAAFLAENGQNGTDIFNQDRTYDVVVSAFADGESPFIIGGPWMVETFQDAGIDLAIDPVPSAGGEAALPFIGVQGFYLSAESPNALVANDFLSNYLSDEEIQFAMYEAGDRPPALTSAAERAAEDPITAGFIAAGDGASAMPSIPEMQSVWTPWGNTEAAIINGSAADPSAAWTQMISDIQSAIDG